MDAFANLSDDDRYAMWVARSEGSYRACLEMEHDVHMVRSFMEWNNANPDDRLLPHGTRGWIIKVAVRSIGSFARSLADNSDDTHSVVPIIGDMIRYPHLLTADRWLTESQKIKENDPSDGGLWAGWERERRLEEYNKTWEGDSSDQNKRRVLGRLLARLPRLNHAIERWVSFNVAHIVRGRQGGSSLTYNDLFSACDAILEVTRDIRFKLSWIHIGAMQFNDGERWPNPEHLK